MFSPKFNFYILTNTLNTDQILSITQSKDECKEFYHKYLCIKHMHTFRPWCDNMNLDYKDLNSWYKYYEAKVNSAERGTYVISKLKLTKKELTALLRAFSKCPLIGCSFETPFDAEIRNY